VKESNTTVPVARFCIISSPSACVAKTGSKTPGIWRTAPGIRAAIIANLGVQQSSRIAKDLVGASAAHAKETLTVRIVLVAADGLELAVFHLDQHSAERWMTVHGTHGPDDYRVGSSHGHLRLRHCA
jgi:hypothetical protein